ncbi:hypothetical protein BD410DRAFT_810839, partial [Rickenella mellea]
SGEAEEEVVKANSSKPAKKRASNKPSKPAKKPLKAGPKSARKSSQKEELTKAEMEYNIWTKGYEEFDAKLGVVRGIAPKWPPFTKVTHSGGIRANSWKVSPQGKKWLMARFNCYVYPPKDGSEYDKARARFDRRKWRRSLGNVYHSLWPDLDLDEYGAKQHPRTARNRVADWLGSMFKRRHKKRAESSRPSTSLDNFFTKLFADRRRPRAYDLWAATVRENPEYIEKVNEQLTNMFGTPEDRTLNERMAARRWLFDHLPEKEQKVYRKLADSWKRDAASPKP